MTSTAILRYRRDLRVHDHPALRAALDGHDRVVPVFVLDDALLHGRYGSGARAAFMLGCLRARDGLDAQPRPARRRLVPDEGPPRRLAAGRGVVRPAAPRRRARAEHR